MGSDSLEPPPLGEVFGSLLSDLPPTDPAIIKAAADSRITTLHYAAIGQVAASWAYFEAVIDSWICSLINVDIELSVCLTAQMIGPRGRLDAFISLARFRGAKSKWNPALDKLAKYSINVGERRNRSLHDIWILSDPWNPIRREATAKKTLRLANIQVPTQELLDLVTEIYALTTKFDDMASAIFTEIHALPEKSPKGTLPSDHTPPPPDKTAQELPTPPEASGE